MSAAMADSARYLVRARKPFVQDEQDRSQERPDAAAEEDATASQYGDHASTVIDMKEKVSPARQRTIFESVFWVAASCFILYYGDGKRHFLEAVLKSPLVILRPFYIASLCSLINTCVFAYLFIIVRLVNKDPRHFDHAAPGTLSAVTLLGIMSYILFSVSLWPVFGMMIIPIIWCFFMTFVVFASLMPSVKNPNPKYLHARQD